MYLPSSAFAFEKHKRQRYSKKNSKGTDIRVHKLCYVLLRLLNFSLSSNGGSLRGQTPDSVAQQMYYDV